ncbi:MAG TPA: HD-GYP domain-containing protein [Thermotogota bacterium]|nr:HD-GYP domain-containing protein [Thermotogota bacterium]HPJ88061.1 HD-GYP domain-containing protein [Thermotogota bacterium]HPR96246.1 HD-GYP domain-containing protein [Thermotogota bacterium]
MIKWKRTDDLTSGDILAETIVGGSQNDVIVKNGEIITEDILKRLHMRGIDWVSVFVKNELDADLHKMITEEKLNEFSSDLSEICVSTFREGRIDVEKSEEISNEITTEIIESYGEYVVPSLVKLKQFDDYTFTHQVNVSIIGTILATDYFNQDREKIEKITLGGLLHDMGKLWIPPEILKSREKLKNVEFDIIKKHPGYGHGIALLSGIEDISILNTIRCHHERWDGKGYLDNLSGKNIPFEGRLLMVADVYDALTTVRPYKTAWEPYDATSFIVKQSKKMFDPDMVHLFLTAFGLYPVNTKLILSTGENAVVVGNKRGAISRPVVSIVRDGEEIKIDLSKDRRINIKEVVKFRHTE